MEEVEPEFLWPDRLKPSNNMVLWEEHLSAQLRPVWLLHPLHLFRNRAARQLWVQGQGEHMKLSGEGPDLQENAFFL